MKLFIAAIVGSTLLLPAVAHAFCKGGAAGSVSITGNQGPGFTVRNTGSKPVKLVLTGSMVTMRKSLSPGESFVPVGLAGPINDITNCVAEY